MSFLPEYPSLTSYEWGQKPEDRRRASKKRFKAERRKTELISPEWDDHIGTRGDFTHSTHECVHDWMRGWEFTSDFRAEPNYQLATAAFVGVTFSADMPSSTNDNAYIEVPSRFIELCVRICEIFGQFSSRVASGESSQRMDNFRSLLFEHLSPGRHDPEVSAALHQDSDKILVRRVTAAAIRWAIAHEMAHLSVGRSGRLNAYNQVRNLIPDLEATHWFTKKAELADFESSLKSYRDEISCDMLALDFVLASPFAKDDLVTQLCGALVACEAIRWDGYFLDGSAVSQTHPSPTLRTQLVRKAWIKRIEELSAWDGRKGPGLFGLRDVGLWAAFSEWAGGSGRGGPSWAAWADEVSEPLVTALRDVLVPDGLLGVLDGRLIGIPEGSGRDPWRRLGSADGE